mmetsp:Transcript_736/g.1703  ORF Transcript_736/g.1703 Transcript_736/m.1703 type:complete len:553 (-) Transcript_736:330-1988(-)
MRGAARCPYSYEWLETAAAVAAAALVAAILFSAVSAVEADESSLDVPPPTAAEACAASADPTGNARPLNVSVFGNPLCFMVVSSDSFLEYLSRSGPVGRAVESINAVLGRAGVPDRSLLTEDELVLSLVAVIMTLVAYFLLFGKRHVRTRNMLAEELIAAQQQVQNLEEALLAAKAQDIQSAAAAKGRKREVRIFMDGAFDMMHYGHMNAFRKAASLGTKLIVGVNSDASITECKGAPLTNDQERLTMVSGCKFVDEVVPGCPYVMNEKYLAYIIEKFSIDYVVHGDDPCIVDGKDVYAAAKEAGKYQSIPRTEGVSTTDIVGRMLTMTTDHHLTTDETTEDDLSVISTERPLCEQSKFLTTSRMVRLFSQGMKAPEKGMRVIYMDGAFDMFHAGHVSILKKAKACGDYLIVGVHGDSLVNRVRGSNLPLMNVHERTLSLMGCQYVDDVLIDAPYRITPEMVASLNIAEVVHGTTCDDDGEGGRNYDDRYAYPKEAGIFTVLDSPSSFNISTIMKRIQENQQRFKAKIKKKKLAEQEYYNDKYGASSNGFKI